MCVDPCVVTVNVRAFSCEPWYDDKSLTSGFEDIEVFFFTDPCRKRGRCKLSVSLWGPRAVEITIRQCNAVGDTDTLLDNVALLSLKTHIFYEDVSRRGGSFDHPSRRSFTGYSPIDPDSTRNIELFIMDMMNSLYGFITHVHWFDIPSDEEVRASEDSDLELLALL